MEELERPVGHSIDIATQSVVPSEGSPSPATVPSRVEPRPWWSRERLKYVGRELEFAGRRVSELVAEAEGPVMLYDTQRVQEQIRTLHTALGRSGQPRRLYYAIKANRFAPLVAAVRATGLCGIDCCSPAEVRLALESGFAPEEISFTGCSVSLRDVAEIAPLGIRINANSISMIHKLGQAAPGRAIGLRLNPQIGVGASPGLVYAGARPTKFGIYPDRIDEAVRLAESYGLRIEGVHMHVGSGWLRDGMPTFLRAVDRLVELASRVGDNLRYINVGGGIGVVHSPDDVAVDLGAYAAGIGSAVRARLGAHVEVCCEPGDFIVNDAVITAATVTEVEEKGGALFVGLDMGFNSNPQAAHYGFIPELLPARRASADTAHHTYVVTGNVNEVIDVFNPAARLPNVHEGDVLVMLNSGGYSSSMRSNHCLRDLVTEIAF